MSDPYSLTLAEEAALKEWATQPRKVNAPQDAVEASESWRGIDMSQPFTAAQVGIGGGPTRATILPTKAEERKKYPVASGVLDYFPDAIAAISNLSWVGNEQHNPGQPLHWARGKSTDEADTMMRHFLQRGTLDEDGQRHSVKMAWRALALLQKELEAEAKINVVMPKDITFRHVPPGERL